MNWTPVSLPGFIRLLKGFAFIAGFCWQLSACAQETPAGSSRSIPADTMGVDSSAARMATAVDAAFLRGFPYRLNQPAEEAILPNDLREVSAISWAGPGVLAMVQDEKGVIFHWDIEREVIIESFRFAKGGDYEGLAIDGETAWVLAAEGILFEVKKYRDEKKRKVKSYPTGLAARDDCEGLALLKSGKRLLVAPKEPKKGAPDHLREIYGWNMGKKQPESGAFLTLDLNEVKKELGRDGRFFFPEEKSAFKPSDVAIHPKTGDIYLLASVGKMLLVLKPNGSLRFAIPLDDKTFRQPEGICFSPTGDLFIASEANGTKARLWRFESK